MDAAKAIALMIANKGQAADFLYRKAAAGQSVPAATNGQHAEEAGQSVHATADEAREGEQEHQALPVVEVPTTCGTGSEATPYAILTVHEKRTKMSIAHRIFPAYALIDGKYIRNTPRSLIVNTAVDALGHYMESYINSNATDFSRMLCTYGMDMWSNCKNVLIGAPAREQDLDRLMTAAAIAGMAISHTGTALPHGLSYYLTYEKGIPHGKAVGYFLPGYLAQANSLLSRRVLQLAGFPDQQYFRSFLHQLIGRAEMDDELMAQAVRGMMANPAKLKNTPFPVTEEKLYQICRAAV
jgi:alcohol dehydrogenase